MVCETCGVAFDAGISICGFDYCAEHAFDGAQVTARLTAAMAGASPTVTLRFGLMVRDALIDALEDLS